MSSCSQEEICLEDSSEDEETNEEGGIPVAEEKSSVDVKPMMPFSL